MTTIPAEAGRKFRKNISEQDVLFGLAHEMKSVNIWGTDAQFPLRIGRGMKARLGVIKSDSTSVPGSSEDDLMTVLSALLGAASGDALRGGTQAPRRGVFVSGQQLVCFRHRVWNMLST